MKKLIVSLLSLTILSLGGPALAEKMDSETQNDVIARLERILSNLDQGDAAWMGTHLRLGDLLSERARLRFMNEIEAKCQGCKGSVADRQRAIKLYEEALPVVPKADQGTVMLQLAHLYDSNGEPKKSEDLFNKIIKGKKGIYAKSLVTRAYAGLGDIAFGKAKHKDAMFNYNMALRDSQAEGRGLMMYRIAWCQFNTDKLVEGTHTLEKLLGSPKLLTKDTEEGPVYDPAFHGDVSRDLATFYARRHIGEHEIAKFKSLIPNDQTKELLLFFADEADRLGEKQAAYTIYKSYLAEPGLTKEEKLDGFIRLAQARYDMGQSSTDDFAVAAMQFKDIKCAPDSDKCAEIQKRMRRYVTELHRLKKVKPTMDVLKTYYIYQKTFPDDSEMAILGAQLAVQMKEDKMALSMYHEGADAADARLRANRFAKDDEKSKPATIKFRETALLGEIDAAERMKDATGRENAYNHYLALLPSGDKSFSVRYQLAQVSYERKDWMKASEAFHTLALDKSGPADLRKKSADLALDALGLLKNDTQIEAWSTQFASLFPASADEYRQIGRKAMMNQVAKTANDDKSSNGEIRAALQKMEATNLRGASDTEKILHYRNESVLAQKAGEDVILIGALNNLLAVKSLSQQDREEALARKVGVYERRLEFRSAYAVALLMKFPKVREADKQIRLATLADLAGLNARKHYEAALNAGLRGTAANSVRARLVTISSNPVRELKRQKELASDPTLMSETLLLVYARTHDGRGLAPLLNDRRLARTNAVRFIQKQPFYASQSQLDRRIANHHLQSQSDAMLGRSIKERVKLLNQADASLKQAIGMNDFTAQILALTTVARENDRVTRELLTLPLPRGLKPAEQAQYTELLKQQAKPYFAKAKVAQSKLAEFWANTPALDSLIKERASARPEVRPMLSNEIKYLAAAASGSARSQLEGALRDQGPTGIELQAARDAVRRNPNSPRDLENLKNLETKMGNSVWSSYLEARLSQSKKGEI